VPNEPNVLYELADSVATITLNRPQARNAINPELHRELIEAVARAGNDSAARAVVIAGAGKSFCAGADLQVFAGPLSPDEVYDYIVTNYRPLMEMICALPKPVIAAVNGAAAGAGASLALAADLRVMADDGVLLQAFSNIGLLPDAGATWLLARQVGYSRAFEMAAEGKPVPAARCLELGLANRVVPAASLLAEAQSWARSLAQRPTLALALTKRAMYHALSSDLLDTIEFEARLQKQTITSADHAEGVRAFAEKRAPRFTGK
jgi:2-(1,2-epoxy-1,2-dihydrophenyl)acetyl-CoA isomerase